MVFGKSVQLSHLYCKLRNENKRNTTRKSSMMFPLSRVKVSHLTLVFLLEKDKSYMHHCSKQTRNLPWLETYIWIYLKLLSLLFYWLSRGILPTLIINGSGQYFRKIIECFWRKSCCELLNFSLLPEPVLLFFFFFFNFIRHYKPKKSDIFFS